MAQDAAGGAAACFRAADLFDRSGAEDRYQAVEGGKER